MSGDATGERLRERIKLTAPATVIRLLEPIERATAVAFVPRRGDRMARDKKVWEPMKLAYAGDVGDILKNAGGTGKSSVSADSGDPHKPPGQG